MIPYSSIVRKWRTIEVALGLIVGLASGILVPYFTESPSFDVSYSSTGDQTMHGYVHSECEKQMRISVDSIKDYELPISLTAAITPPESLEINFIPEGHIPAPNFTSIAVIKPKQNISDGNFKIYFIGNGKDGLKDMTGEYLLTIYTPKFINFENGIVPAEICGDNSSISIENSNSSANCTRIAFKPHDSNRNGWSGFNLNASSLQEDNSSKKCFSPTIKFLGRGEKGGETIEVKIGGLSSKLDGSPNLYCKSYPLKLKRDWTEYNFPVNDKELDYIINENYSEYLVGGLGVVVNRKANINGCTFFLDDIEYAI